MVISDFGLKLRLQRRLPRACSAVCTGLKRFFLRHFLSFFSRIAVASDKSGQASLPSKTRKVTTHTLVFAAGSTCPDWPGKSLTYSKPNLAGTDLMQKINDFAQK